MMYYIYMYVLYIYVLYIYSYYIHVYIYIYYIIHNIFPYVITTMAAWQRPNEARCSSPVAITSITFHNWLVVLTILKDMSQWEGLSHMVWKIKIMFETTNQLRYTIPSGKQPHSYWKWPIYSRFTPWKWWFSIVM